MKSKSIQDNLIGKIVICLLLLWSFINIYPYFYLVIGSLKQDRDFYTSILNFKVLTFDSYEKMFALEELHFIRALFNSLFVAGAVTLATLFFSAITGYAISKLDFKGKSFIANFIIFQWIFTGTGVGFIVVFKLMVSLNLLSTYTALTVPFLMSAWGVFLFSQYFKTIPMALIESARIEGCSEFGIIFRIMIPMSKSVAAILGVFTFMGRWNDLLWSILVIRKPHMMTLNLSIANFVLGGGGRDKPGLIFAATVILTLPLLILFIIYRKQFITGISIGGGLKL
ncbi:MAG: carbohydrate ABC transporter permease [Spirochaetales bacterium]|nr:carbohydrate ABC transporter permease [Spirochaetales bacterium]